MRSRLAKPIDGMRNQARLWIPENEIEQSAMEQIHTMMRDRDIGNVRIMPDVHAGVGVPIGTLFDSTKVFPTAVGVDIGCGIRHAVFEAMKTPTDTAIREWAERVHEYVSYSGREDRSGVGGLVFRHKEVQSAFDVKRAQYGTLGGGNHFVELLVEEHTGRYVIAVHSGSRGIGHITATIYDRIFSELDPDGAEKKLPRLVQENRMAQDYLADAGACTSFASTNRALMSIAAYNIMYSLVRSGKIREYDACHNNFQRNGNLITYQKGANVYSSYSREAFIPGSMGTKSYVVTPASQTYMFSSHGAGRVMSRGAAKRGITEERFAETMRGVLTAPNMALIDEAPDAYKDIDMVMSYQDGLVNIVRRLTPIITIKGVK